ncbi:sensor histidine kinase [Enterococcus durans]|uniref:sensor histidine kinase n=1 Tax=Enterococcus durans TaxID=53345 RepID=UPI0035D53C9A
MRKKATFLLAMLVIFIMAILIIIGYFYYQTVKTNQSNLVNLTENQLAYANKRMQDGQRTIEENASTILIYKSVKDLRGLRSRRENQEYLDNLLNIKKMLKEHLINNSEMASISICWPKSNIFISTETNLNMKKELPKSIPNGGEWRTTERGLYFFMKYTFGNIENDEVIVAIKMSDALLLETQEMLKVNANESAIVLPNRQIFGGSKKIQSDVYNAYSLLEKNKGKEVVQLSRSLNRFVVDKVPDSEVLIVTALPTSDNDVVYTRNTIIIASAIVFIVLFGCVLIFLYYRNVVSELRLFIDKLQKVEQGNYDIRIDNVHNNEFGYLFEQFNQMVSSIQKLLKSLSKEIKQRELAEERQFQSQIQPHFLYNSLFYIVSVADDPKAVVEMTRHLAGYYRYLTKKLDTVTIGEEIDFARHYLIVQALRKEFEFEINMIEGAAEIPILPLLIQPLIENAIAHGIEAKDGAKKIIVNVKFVNDNYSISIEDDGPGISEEGIHFLESKINLDSREEVSASVGLWNVNQRLMNYYGHTSRLKFSQSVLGGLSVSFEFNPKEGINENETIDS